MEGEKSLRRRFKVNPNFFFFVSSNSLETNTHISRAHRKKRRKKMSAVNDFFKGSNGMIDKFSNSLDAVDVLKWCVIPGVLAYVVFFAIVAFLRLPVTGSYTYWGCTGDKERQRCSEKTYNNRYNVLIYIFAPILGACIVASSTYRLGFFIKNPKLGTAASLYNIL